MAAGSLDRSASGGGAPLLNELGVVTPLHYRILALCFLGWIFDFYDLILYSFLLVPIARELHLSAMDSSFAIGVSLLMTAVGGVAFGFAGDRFGRRPVIIATVLIYSLGTLLCATTHSVLELVAYRAFTGIGIGGEWAAGQSMIAETFPRHSRARYAGYVQTGAPLGVLMAAVAGGYLAPAWGWRAVFALSAGPAILVAAAIWRWLPESDVWLNGRSGRWFSLEDWHALRPHRAIAALLFLVMLINSEAYWFTYSWLPGYLELKRGLTSQASGRLVITMQCAAIAGYMAFGMIADRYGRRPAFSLRRDDGAGIAPGDDLLALGGYGSRPDRHSHRDCGLRNRNLVGRWAAGFRAVADPGPQHRAGIVSERHARNPVLHPARDHRV